MRRPYFTLAALPLAVLAGCLPVDESKPECFPDEGCAGGQACVAGRCEAPDVRRAVVTASCLGAPDAACVGSVNAAAGGPACLLVGAQAIPVRWAEGALSGPDGTAGVEVAAASGARVPVSLFLLAAEGETACAEGGLDHDTACTADAFCVARLERDELVVPADAEFDIDFAGERCALSWAPDSAPAELCDAADQDCDGAVDEDFAELGSACEAGAGACRAEGVVVCLDAQATGCGAEPGAAADEVPADGVDNDCDGAVDEEEECAPGEIRPCGRDLGACRAGTATCVDGRLGPCVDEMGEPVQVPDDARPEPCDGLDNDCDGTADEGNTLGPEGPAVGEACAVGEGACAAAGVVACVDGAAACDAAPVVPADETCNAADDDCDGAIDEGFEVGAECVAGVGVCAVAGRTVCAGDGSARCNVEPGLPADEVCDGLDNDCDEATDEGFEVGEACTVNEGTPCESEGALVCADDRAGAVCDAPEAPPPEVEVCNQLDDDCDGAVDEAFDLQNDVLNCGLCGAACELPNATAACVEGTCAVDACQGGFEDRDADPANGCECNPLADDAPDPAFVDSNCDGLDGTANRAVFVSNAGDDDAGNGSPEAPYATLERAFIRAEAADFPVYLATGEYALAETLEVPSGLSIHGGYLHDPEAGTWTRVALDAAETLIRGPATAVRYADLGAPTLLDNVVVASADAAPGESSVAVQARAVGDFLTLRQVRLRPGAGGAGDDGAPGERGEVAGASGQDGRVHDDPEAPGAGGAGADGAVCGAGDGGDGGDGAIGLVDATDGEAGLDPRGDADGEGGEARGPGADGVDGSAGTLGLPGENGAPADAAGRITAEGRWVPFGADTGARGFPGGGGGGGGGGGNAGQGDGGGGGGGGAGGCPGGGGGGATGGGGSFGLVVMGGRVTLAGVRVDSARGGDGGDGGPGGLGGGGGPGGAGAVGCGAPCGDGGDGGRGGAGGCGGHGPGGPGGPAAAVLRVAPDDRPGAVDASIVAFTDVDGAPIEPPAALDLLSPGVGGAGGLGGDREACGEPAADGPAGLSARVGCCAAGPPAERCATLEACEE